jgi:hypothetical protein
MTAFLDYSEKPDDPAQVPGRTASRRAAAHRAGSDDQTAVAALVITARKPERPKPRQGEAVGLAVPNIPPA